MTEYLFEDLPVNDLLDTLSVFQNKPNARAIRGGFAQLVQEANESTLDIVQAMRLDSLVGWGLERWAAIVDELRGSLTEEEWTRVVRGKIAAVVSQGDGTSLAEVVVAAFPDNVSYTIDEYQPATIIITVTTNGGISPQLAPRFKRLLRLAKTAGVRLEAGQAPPVPFTFFGGVGLGFNEGAFAGSI